MSLIKQASDGHVEPSMRIGAAIVAVGMTLGAIFLFLYTADIEHFPAGLTLSDGLVLLVVAGFFFLIYATFLITLTSLGITLSVVVRPLLMGLRRLFGAKRPPPFELVRPNWMHPFLGLIGLIFIAGFGRHDPYLYASLPLISFALYVTYSAWLSEHGKSQTSGSTDTDPVVAAKTAVVVDRVSPATHRRNSWWLLGIGALLPLFMGGIFIQLRDGTMRLLKIRVDSATVYVKSPYAELIPKSAGFVEGGPKDYAKHEKMRVLFRAIGRSTVVRFLDDKKWRQLEIPNEFVIVEIPINGFDS